MTKQQDIETICPANRAEWREWLKENHLTKNSIWLIYYKKKKGSRELSWSDAVDEALCFGWIDSTARSIDDDRYMQFFGKRKPTSVWSKINKDKIIRLTELDLIAPAGYESIEKAKQNGSWTILDAVEELSIPEDLQQAFSTRAGAEAFFLGLSKSVRKMMLQWIIMAKRAETREKRINEIADLAAEGKKPKQF